MGRVRSLGDTYGGDIGDVTHVGARRDEPEALDCGEEVATPSTTADIETNDARTTRARMEAGLSANKGLLLRLPASLMLSNMQ